MADKSSDISISATTPAVPIHKRRCVIIPSHNSGPEFVQLVRKVLAVWQPVIVVIDGTTDGSDEPVSRLTDKEPGLHVLTNHSHSGRGVSIFSAFNHAIDNGFTHAAVFDADGQNDTGNLQQFMEVSQKNPHALIMGVPQFGPETPKWRILGHRVADFFAKLETLRCDFDSSLFGLRVYPLYSALKIMQKMHGGYHDDFDTHMAVRLAWHNYPMVRLPAKALPPRKPRTRVMGKLGHFLLVAYAHGFLLIRSMTRWPQVILQRIRRPHPFDVVRNRD